MKVLSIRFIPDTTKYSRRVVLDVIFKLPWDQKPMHSWSTGEHEHQSILGQVFCLVLLSHYYMIQGDAYDFKESAVLLEKNS